MEEVIVDFPIDMYETVSELCHLDESPNQGIRNDIVFMEYPEGVGVVGGAAILF
jgi:hypothetical protein